MYDTGAGALSRLYRVFTAAPPPDSNNTSQLNYTEAWFTDVLRPRIEKYQNQFRIQRAAVSQPIGIAPQCPFTAPFSITPGNFDNAIPPETEFSTNGPVSPFIASTDERHGASSGVGVAIGSYGVLTAVPSMFVGRREGYNDGVNEQEVYVEMKRRFVSECCRTEINVVIATIHTENLFGKDINYTLLVTVVAFVWVIVRIKQMEMTPLRWVPDEWP